ncbi:MAG TPA: GAF domain-containing sensor histidine kinase, partial [Bryobacteraceae bacterium]|nr:GAF domain-containing sensor histidine kinase [Bryobacteraceae bacterium]
YQVREAESQAFYDLFRVEVESRSLDEMLRRFLDVLLRFTGADAGRIHIAGGPGAGWTLAASVPPAEVGVPVAVPPRRLRVLAEPRCLGGGSADVLDSGWQGLYQTVWSVPLKSEGSLGGVMQFGFRQSFAWLPRETELLAAAAERCWLAAEKARLMEDLAQREEQVRRLAEHMVEVEESERRRISRELHDEAGQSLLCIRLQLEMIEQELPPEAAPLRQRLVETRQTTEHTILEIRRLIAALSPAVLEQMGLAAALRQLVARFRRLHPAEVRLQLPRRIELPKKVEIIVYRLVQEIFNNISKYSLASTVNLSLGSADGILRMSVEDDGVGFNVEEALSRRDCFGLSGLRERVALLGGTLVVQSRMRAAGQVPVSGRKTKNERPRGAIGVDRPGTAIRIELPVPAPAQGPRKKSRTTR